MLSLSVIQTHPSQGPKPIYIDPYILGLLALRDWTIKPQNDGTEDSQIWTRRHRDLRRRDLEEACTLQSRRFSWPQRWPAWVRRARFRSRLRSRFLQVPYSSPALLNPFLFPVFFTLMRRYFVHIWYFPQISFGNYFFCLGLDRLCLGAEKTEKRRRKLSSWKIFEALLSRKFV